MDRSRARFERIERWQATATAILSDRWVPLGLPYSACADAAAAVVAMFDAGATDAEVARYLEQLAVPHLSGERAPPSHFAALARELHRAARGPLTRPPA